MADEQVLVEEVAPPATYPWVVERSTGKFMVVFRDASVIHRDGANYELVNLPVGRVPDGVLERWDFGTGAVRTATAAEQLESRREQIAHQAVVDLRQNLILKAVCHVVAELHGLTPAQLQQQVAEKYRQLREAGGSA